MIYLFSTVNNTRVIHLGGTDIPGGEQRYTIYEYEGADLGWRLWENVLPMKVDHGLPFFTFPEKFCDRKKNILMDDSYRTGNFDHYF